MLCACSALIDVTSAEYIQFTVDVFQIVWFRIPPLTCAYEKKIKKIIVYDNGRRLQADRGINGHNWSVNILFSYT